METGIVKSAAATYLAPKVLRGFRLRWLAYGAAAYFALRYLNKRGIMQKQTGAALDLIDQGVKVAKEGLGFADATVPTKSEGRAVTMTH